MKPQWSFVLSLLLLIGMVGQASDAMAGACLSRNGEGPRPGMTQNCSSEGPDSFAINIGGTENFWTGCFVPNSHAGYGGSRATAREESFARAANGGEANAENFSRASAEFSNTYAEAKDYSNAETGSVNATAIASNGSSAWARYANSVAIATDGGCAYETRFGGGESVAEGICVENGQEVNCAVMIGQGKCLCTVDQP
jgi:hypothetical protein